MTNQEEIDNDEPVVSWDRSKLERLKIANDEAKTKEGAIKTDSFFFDELEFVIGYADKLIEFLEQGLST